MSIDKETLYKQTFRQAKSTRGELTRRRVLQTSAALAAGAAVTSNLKVPTRMDQVGIRTTR